MVIRIRTALVVLLFSFLCLACSKSGSRGNNNPPVPTSKPDTLSAGWSKRIIGNSAVTFTDVFFADAATGYATGQTGIFRSTDGGLNWSQIYSGNDFINIAANGLNACFVNRSDTIYFTANAGATIQKRRYPSPGNSYPDGFMDVFYTPAGKCVAASSQYIFRSLDGGAVFDSLFRFVNSPPGLNTLWFLDETEGWFARGDGIYRTINGGLFWERYNRPTPGDAYYITYYSLPLGYLSAPNAVYKTNDNGNSWQNVFSGTLGSGYYIDISVIDNQTAYFCYGNRIYKTTNGGLQWTVAAAMGEASIIEVHFLDANTGWACGSDGTILRFKQ